MVQFSWSAAATVLSLSTLVSAYRPVQHCKPLGDNGHYSACLTVTQHHNQTTDQPDLYARYHWYKYKNSKDGWHAFALGQMMAGGFMIITYGDPTASPPDMTVSVRSAEGHHMPQLVSDMAVFQRPEAKGRIPEVEVLTSKFEPYTGPFVHPELNIKPTHVGIAEVIIRGFAKWVGTKVTNTSDAEPMLWSSRHDQDFAGDYSLDRSLDMHAFGLGFGNMFMDFSNVATPIPMFAPVHEMDGSYGLLEFGTAAPPTADELALGEKYIANALNDPINVLLQSSTKPATDTDDNGDNHNPFGDHNTTPSINPDVTEPIPHPDADTTTNAPTPAPTIPAYTIKGKSLRDWMWHLHGLLMVLAFFIGYPLGIYYLRQSKAIQKGEAFNYHWTINALATMTFALGCFIAWFQSKSISVTHQYVGITMVFLIISQMLLGWRHHVKFLITKRKTIMSRFHVGLGRVILPLGFVNILSGMKLRGYGWFTMLLVLLVIVVEVVFGAIYLRNASVRRSKMGAAAVAEDLKQTGPSATDDAEEYFQLAGPEDEWSDEDAEAASGKKRQDKTEQNQRLARLDRV